MMRKVTENLKFFKSRFKYDNDDELSHETETYEQLFIQYLYFE